MQAVKQPVTLENFEHREALKMLLLLEELWLMLFVALLVLLLYTYYVKLRVYGLKTYGINGKEALTGDWEELNKETYVCNICYKTTSRFTSPCKYKLINLLIFIFARR